MADPKVIFYSDFNCPFCYALNERILALGETARVEWRGIEHMPAADAATSTLVDQTQLINEVSVVRKRAPEVALITPAFRPNTGLANRLVLALEGEPRASVAELRTRIYRAYWQDELDIGSAEVLAQLCRESGLGWPQGALLGADEVRLRLGEWQREWEADPFSSRLPAMLSVTFDKPVLGFPTYDLLSNFFAGNELELVPESLAACELKPRQSVLLVGGTLDRRCNTLELEVAYQITRLPEMQAADVWFEAQSCLPDLVVIDAAEDFQAACHFCTQLRQRRNFRHMALILLLAEPDPERELEAFYAGATDVLLDLSNPKLCQARLDLHLRLKRSSALLGTLARLDYLTELPNRRETDRKLEEEWVRLRRLGAELSVIMIDIDHFKNYNDHYGHSLGDDCLRQVARAMAGSLHRPADMLGRYGGEEFIAILPETSLPGARLVAEELVSAVRKLALPHAWSSAADVVTISAGVATQVSEALDTPRHLTEAADQALYLAKMAGRNRVQS